MKFQSLIVDSGPYKKKVKRTADNLGLNGLIKAIPAVPHNEISKYYNCVDILVVPSRTTKSWKEQFGRVLIEAMACGMPVIGSSSGDVPNIIRKTGGGLIFQERNIKDLAARMCELLKDDRKRKEFGQRGREKVTQLYSCKVLARQFYVVYKQLLRDGQEDQEKKRRMRTFGKLTLYKVGRAIFRFTIAHPDNIRLATLGPVVRRLLPPKIDKALDIGCGRGRYTEWLVERAGRVSGIDINMKNLSGLRRKGINASVVCASAEYGLPFRDSIFDFILCTEVLEHLQNDVSAVKEMRRVLQENGELLISVPMPPPVYHDSAHKRDGYTLNKLETLLEENGFEITHVDYCILAISRLMLRFVSQFIRLFRFSPPILPFIYLEHLIFHNHHEKTKFKPFDLVIKARKKP